MGDTATYQFSGSSTISTLMKSAMDKRATRFLDFDADSKDYDIRRAVDEGMGPDGSGENEGHWGSVAKASDREKSRYGLPEESYVMLKGRGHESFMEGVAFENARGFEVVKRGSRYFSIPRAR